MKKINKLITILFAFAIVSFFSFAKGDECDDFYNEYDNCLTDCRHNCTILNPINPGSCISQCTGNCNAQYVAYQNCVVNGPGEGGDPELVQWQANCPGIDVNTENVAYINILNGSCCFDGGGFEPQCSCEIQPDANGNCLAGYRNDGVCCVLVCQGSGYLSGDINSEYTCESCIEGETIPNANHTKCVCDSNYKCCGIKLNTVVPFIGDCIEMNTDSSRGDTTSVTSVTAFPILVQGLMKILMSAIMIFSFLMVIVAGLLMTTGAFGGSGFTKGKTIIKNVVISLILLGCSGLILSLINPNFFGG